MKKRTWGAVGAATILMGNSAFAQVEAPKEQEARVIEVTEVEDAGAEAEQAKQGATLLRGAKSDTSRAVGVARAWAHESSDLKADPRVLYGKLANGMRYAIMKNTRPPEKLSMRLHIAAGSLNEREDQRGVAHFLEHLVFNGSRTYPDASQLVPTMQRKGIAFGSHINAYTSFDETVYMLDVSDKSEQSVDLIFDVMADFADGALLAEEEIDKERGVILAEKTSRDSIQSRVMREQLRMLMPKSRLGQRFPIGLEKVIAEAPRKAFVDFYTDFYIPEKMTLVVVGDLDVAEIEQRIHQKFGIIGNPTKAGGKPDVGDLTSERGLNSAVFADRELKDTEVSLYKVKEHVKEQDSEAKRIKEMPLEIAQSMLNNRLSKLVKKEDSPVVSAVIYDYTMFNAVDVMGFDVKARQDQWQRAVPFLEKELRRAVDYGFTQREYDEAIAKYRNAYEQAVASYETIKTPALAKSLVESAHEDEVFITAEKGQEIFEKAVKVVTREACHKALKEAWAGEDATLVLTTPKQPEDEKIVKDMLLSLYERSFADVINPQKEEELSAFAYTEVGEPSGLKSENSIDDLGVHQLIFNNGVRVNVKQTDFDKNEIMLSAHFGHGKLSQPKDKPGIDMVAAAVVNGGGLGKHSVDDLNSLLSGKSVGLSFGVSSDHFVFSGGTTPKDLEAELQLLCAYLRDPGYREESIRQFRKTIPMIYQTLKHTGQGAQAQYLEWVHGHDGRFSIPEREKLEALGIDEVKQWVHQPITESAIEIGIVGDIDIEVLKPLLAKTVGALPQRAKQELVDSALSEIKVPAVPQEVAFEFESRVPTATVVVAWKAKDATDKDVKFVRRANILADILDDRMRVKIREELGDAYSPGAYFNASFTWQNMGFFQAISPVKVDALKKVNQVILELAQELAEDGATQDELERVLKPNLNSIKETERKNDYWMNVIGQSQSQPHRLDWSREREADYRSITLEEINAMAAKYLVKERALSAELKPKS